MAKRARTPVADSDLYSLSRIYLSLIHKNYKAEATEDAEEMLKIMEGFKSQLVIINGIPGIYALPSMRSFPKKEFRFCW